MPSEATNPVSPEVPQTAQSAPPSEPNSSVPPETHSAQMEGNEPNSPPPVQDAAPTSPPVTAPPAAPEAVIVPEETEGVMGEPEPPQPPPVQTPSTGSGQATPPLQNFQNSLRNFFSKAKVVIQRKKTKKNRFSIQKYKLPKNKKLAHTETMQCENEKRWNIFFFFFYLVLAAAAISLLYNMRGGLPTSIPTFDLVIIIFAIFRLIRLFIYDRITYFIREWFEEIPSESGCYKSGFNASVFHVLSCPWCMGVWIALPVFFFYLLTPFAWLPILMLAAAGLASFGQLIANLIGWNAENTKRSVEKK